MFTLWVALLLSTRHPMEGWITGSVPVSLMLRIDPLVLTAVTGAMRMGISILMLGFVTLGVSLLLGRVFCGWVCPLGTIFDLYGWILKRLKMPIEGPSPSWFRFKYYLLFAILLFSAFGVVSPLMGFDPIVLITRVSATLIGPFERHAGELPWQIGGMTSAHGALIDFSTLFLFMLIMSATTRLSRIWCRTVCPLGAYLAIASRNSVLKRDTSGCVHCNICTVNCPTGAISFENPEVYNESECIKCFTCSQACPVDANFFTFKSPIPAMTKSQEPVSLSRRSFVTTTIAAAAATPILNLSAGEPNSVKKLIRPPMSREERDFLSSCIRCGECMRACPSGILKPAGLEHGLRSLWTPVMVASEGDCVTGCNACSQACPTDAITKYPIAEKYRYKAGTAVFNASSCISHTEGKFCSECVRVCPTDAIRIEKDWEPEGERITIGRNDLPKQGSDRPAPEGLKPTRPIKVDYGRCVGCGACETSCTQIVAGESAMTLTSAGRATPTTLSDSEKS